MDMKFSTHTLTHTHKSGEQRPEEMVAKTAERVEMMETEMVETTEPGK